MRRMGRVGRAGRVGVLLLAFIAPLAPFELVFAQRLPPELTKPVNDFANIIDAESEAEIERRILELKKASGDVVVVATIETFQPDYADINEYAVRMFENRGRGIGDKGKDNGVLIVLAVKDRRVRVEVGYDLEQFITDQFAGDVSRTDMAPYFARGDYGAGLLSGSSRIIGRIAQGRGVTLQNVPMPEPQPTAGIQVSPWVIFVIIIVIMLMSNSGGRRSRMRRGGPYWGGGNWSGWNSGVGPFGGGGGRIGGGGFGGGFGGFGGGRSGGGGGGASW